MKTLPYLSLLLLSLLPSPKAIAQMMPHTYNLSTPHGNVPITYFVPMPRYYGGQQGASTYKMDYTIALHNDSLFEVHAKIDLADTTHFIKVKRGKEKVKIYPKDTKKIYAFNFSGIRMEGIPADSCWLFKTQSGKINTYTFIPESDSPFVIALQKGKEGPIVGFTEQNVTDMVADNEEAMKYVQKKKLLKAVKVYNKEAK